MGWFVFDQTDSALLTAISFTMQSAPRIVVAPFAGAIVDRIERRYVLAAAALVKGLTALGLALAAGDGIESVVPVILLLAIAGAMTIRKTIDVVIGRFYVENRFPIVHHHRILRFPGEHAWPA